MLREVQGQKAVTKSYAAHLNITPSVTLSSLPTAS